MKSQRDLMRELAQRFGSDTDRIISEYAAAEERGEVERERNAYGILPADYARRLWNDAVKKGWLTETPEGRSKTGVRIAAAFRDNLIVDRYDPSFITMRGAKTESMRSENSEDVLTWNVFRSLAQVDPAVWYPWLFERAFPGLRLERPQDVAVRLWVRLPPPPTLRLHQKDEGESEIDVLIETERSVWAIEAKYRSDVSERTTNNPDRDQVLRNIDVGTWYAGVRNFYFSLLLLDGATAGKGTALVDRCSPGAAELMNRLPHRHDALKNLHGVGILRWSSLASVLSRCAKEAPRADERANAERAVAWLQTKHIPVDAQSPSNDA